MISKKDVIELKNDKERMEFLEGYRKWKMIRNDKEMEERIFECVLPDQCRIVVRESLFEWTRYPEKKVIRDYLESAWYKIEVNDKKPLASLKTNKSAIKDKLKKLKKVLENE